MIVQSSKEDKSQKFESNNIKQRVFNVGLPGLALEAAIHVQVGMSVGSLQSC